MYPPIDTPIVGRSAATQELLGLVKVLANSHSTVLISGESGTGKELVAQALHRQGPRRNAPFVPINCGAIPKDLLESELFGHRKGAFTGAVSDRIGRFEMAQGGTLFLDEIGDLPVEMQVKLLRVLQDRTIHPVGASRGVAIDVRVIAATHKNLAQDVLDGRFREDLYYRLNVLPCHTTPLRERPEDIADLLVYYADYHAMDGRAPIRFGRSLMSALCNYAWPGNVRELSNLVDRFTTLFPAQVVELHAIPSSMLPPGLRPLGAAPAPAPMVAERPAYDLFPMIGALDEAANSPVRHQRELPGLRDEMMVPEPPHNVVEEIICLAQGIVNLPPEGLPLKQQLVNIERSLIEQALQRTNGNVSQTARLLKLQRTTLIEKIQKYELKVG